MVRFLCFSAQVHSPKPKKTVQHSADKMYKTSQVFSQSQAPMDSPNHTNFNPSFLKVEADTEIDTHVTSVSSVESGWNSVDMGSKLIIESEFGFKWRGHLKKSQSLGSGLFQEGGVSAGNDTEDEIYQGLSCEGFHDYKAMAEPGPSKYQGVGLPDEYTKIPTLDSFRLNPGFINNEPIFSIEDPLHSEKEGHENSDTQLYGECPGDSGDLTPRSPPLIVKSYSLPNIGASAPISGICSPYRRAGLQSRSFEDLNILNMRRGEISAHESERQDMQEQVKDDGFHEAKKNTLGNSDDDGYDSHNYSGLAKDWIMPATDEVRPVETLIGESSVYQQDDLPGKDFKIKRIEEWVNDLRFCGPVEEANDSSQSDDLGKRDSNILNSLTAAKVDGKVNPGMEAAKRYISSLSAIATTAQLANHGLVTIPFLSAFTSLRLLNLSGNAIARITAGALPRGLHMLNLSRNNISTIDGLRELTRLRILNLSYNRIFRIGHGLASCSALKELYLAGNKISEVEGLHRLLKLNVLDLRINKISTAKCLGQLAANYNSLQAISLEGNPCQKNVGDEQLKKYVQGLLPYLTYFNRLPLKASTFKDVADRSVRSGISSHQLDRGIRSDHKATRKISHGLAAHRPSSSSIHGRKSQAVASPKRSNARHGLLPPTGTKATTHDRHNFDFSSKLQKSGPEISIRRSQSEGILRAL
ncbi:uncharacterized protein LOC121249062 [Juglans microcarpa x Juglans regia]|uniref:uncharacterized protein LOC121249062 n=1 Tax=Juglans microcarpa x Juglans regia TaxID=2249226 RepID=UPI001B7E0ED2|nr:uncharacterized protein LOC121249062 [Juglans microcarpa x Juglans regia]XP_041003651.1 uncharacterized protein LOC121249062 [Juglans microcarpa x Juglans regia]